MTNAPEIEPRTAAAMCADTHLGMPALDDWSWQGASDAARSCDYADWSFCYDDEKNRVDAQNAEGDVFTSYHMGPWEAS